MKKPAAAKRAIEGTSSPDEVPDRFHKMVEVYATKARVKWGLPASAEEELRAYGYLGYSEALAKFDADRGFAFNTFAEHRVRGAIQNGAEALHYAKRIGASSLAARSDGDAGDKWDRLLDVAEDMAAGTAIAVAYEPDDPEENVARKETCELMRAALASLPQRRRDLLRWSFYEDVDGKEVAGRLNVHKSRLCHLKAMALTQLLQRFNELKDPKRGT